MPMTPEEEPRSFNLLAVPPLLLYGSMRRSGATASAAARKGTVSVLQHDRGNVPAGTRTEVETLAFRCAFGKGRRRFRSCTRRSGLAPVARAAWVHGRVDIDQLLEGGYEAWPDMHCQVQTRHTVDQEDTMAILRQ